MKRKLKQNRVLLALAVIIIISLILMAIGLVSYFYGNNDDKYGDRLKDKDKYPISENISEEIKSLYEKNVNDVKVDVRGKIIYIILNVDKDTSSIDAQSYAESALEKFTEEELKYYDIQFMITCKDEEKEEDMELVYPLEGYKNSNSMVIVWTN